MQLNAIYLEKIVAAMCEHLSAKTDAKKAKYETIATDWIVNSHNYCLINSHYDEDNNLYLAVNKVQKNFIHRYRKDGKMQYWYHWFVDNFPQWHVLLKGFSYSNGSKASQVMLLNPFTHKKTSITQRIEMIRDIGQSGYYEKNLEKINKQLTQKPGSQIIEQKINLDNLQVYIMDTNDRLENDTMDPKYKKTLQLNLEAAYKILAVLNPDNCTIPVLVTPHSFGREFHGGINLQGAHKELRKAALGACTNIDVEASVFGYYLRMLEEIKYYPNLKNITVKPEHIRILEIMMQDRTRFRQTLVNDCFSHLSISNEEKIKIVKNALTALGFGAKKDNFRYFKEDNDEITWKDAIPKTILDETARNNFMNHKAVQILCEIVKVLLDAVKTMYKTNPRIKKEIDALPEIANRKRMNYKQVLSYMYQKYEKQIRNIMINVIEEDGREVLLQTHDGIFVNCLQPGDTLEMERLMQKINPYAKVEIEEINGYVNRKALNEKKAAIKDQLTFEEIHKQFIREEEKMAKKDT